MIGFTDEVWRRLPMTGPGHARIYVRTNHLGIPSAGLRSGEVQCFTMDKIPFCMKRKALVENYCKDFE